MNAPADLCAVPSHWLDALKELRERLGTQAVLLGNDIPVRNHSDWSLQPPVPPLALARPSDTAGVAEVLKVCHAHGIPVVPQGGLTGLSGGAHPMRGALALSLERLTGIEELDAANATMTVRAGTPLQQIQEAAERAGLLFALDLGSRGSCAIGGNLATNAGGTRVIRYGMARDLTLGLEVVLADGTVINGLRKMVKDNAGYDLRNLFIGSEGTLGIITRAVLRLHPMPASVTTALCALPSFDALIKLLQGARSNLGQALSAFEVMWPDYWQAATTRVGLRDPFDAKHALYALIELQGTDAGSDPERFASWLGDQLEAGLLTDAAVAQSAADAADFWTLRDACSEFPVAIGPHISYDVGLAVEEMQPFVTACKQRLRSAINGCESVYYGHVGDGNLHIDVWVPGEPYGEQPKDVMDRTVYQLVQAHGGSVSAEHGVGTTKKAWLHMSRSPQELMLMRQIKRTLDPANILNPGKVLALDALE